jgi:hypothetical protein
MGEGMTQTYCKGHSIMSKGEKIGHIINVGAFYIHYCTGGREGSCKITNAEIWFKGYEVLSPEEYELWLCGFVSLKTQDTIVYVNPLKISSITQYHSGRYGICVGDKTYTVTLDNGLGELKLYSAMVRRNQINKEQK